MSAIQKSELLEGLDKPRNLSRDQLALDRTVLANERTFLAYLRSALALFVGGISLVHFFDMTWAQWGGIVMIPLGPIILLWGAWRFIRLRQRLGS